jgi:hypothetical protein
VVLQDCHHAALLDLITPVPALFDRPASELEKYSCHRSSRHQANLLGAFAQTLNLPIPFAVFLSRAGELTVFNGPAIGRHWSGCALLPQAIMCFLVNHVKAELQNEMVTRLWKRELFEELLQEDPMIAKQRGRAVEMVRALERASTILTEVGTWA